MSKRRELGYLTIIILLLGLCGQFYFSYKYKPYKEREIKVFYTKDTRANEQIIKTIQDADSFVYFAIYTFTRTDIKDALLGAKHRGLALEGVTDAGQTENGEVQNKIIEELEKAGIPVYRQNHSALMHIKTVVTDKGYASGSYNWTGAATDSNDEVIEIGKDESVRKQYENILKKIISKYKM